jgi:hypothetical protein
VPPSALLGASWLPCRPPCSAARRLPCSHAGLSSCYRMPAVGICHSASPPPVSRCRAAGHQATLPSGGPASTLPTQCGGTSGLPPSLLGVAAPPCSMPGCCSVVACGPPACAPCSRQSASPPPVPACRLPCPQGSGLHPPCLAPPCSTGSSAQHLGPAAPAGLLPARRDDASRQSVPSLSLLQTPVLYATVSGIVLLLKFDLSCLNFFAI